MEAVAEERTGRAAPVSAPAGAQPGGRGEARHEAAKGQQAEARLPGFSPGNANTRSEAEEE